MTENLTPRPAEVMLSAAGIIIGLTVLYMAVDIALNGKMTEALNAAGQAVASRAKPHLRLVETGEDTGKRPQSPASGE